MINAQWDALRHADCTSRRTLLAAALALATQWGGAPASDARKKRKKRKSQRKQTCGTAGVPPIKGQCCAGAAAVDGVCQTCHVCGSGCRFSTVQGAIDAAKARGGVVGQIQRLGLTAAAAVSFAWLYLTPVKRNTAPATVRLVPAW